jgi:hypothetical protein
VYIGGWVGNSDSLLGRGEGGWGVGEKGGALGGGGVAVFFKSDAEGMQNMLAFNF